MTTTLPRLLRRNAETMAQRPAIREKNRGIWQTYTWSQYNREVCDFASGLAAHGFRRADLLAVVGDNRPRLYWAQLAAQCLGGVAVPVYQDSIAAELVYVLDHAEVSVIVAEDQEQADKILALSSSTIRAACSTMTCRSSDLSRRCRRLDETSAGHMPDI